MGDARESVIEVDSEEEERGKEAEAAAAGALRKLRPLRSIFGQLTLPPSRGLNLPQVVGRVEVWCQDACLFYALQEYEDESFVIPLKGIHAVEAKLEGPSVILTLSPPLAPSGFAIDYMAEGHRISMVTLSPSQDLQQVLATFMSWLRHLTVHGPRSLGLVPRPSEEPFSLRLFGTVLEERDVDLLEDEQWFNDTIMDFFLRLAAEVAAPESLKEEIYVAKTQFFTRLTASGASSGEKGWENVKTWTRTVSGGVASQRVLVYPVNEANLHWCVFFVCHPYMVMNENSAADDMPRIVCLDSAWDPVPKDDHIKLLKGYLRRELFTSGNGFEYSPATVAKWKAAVSGLEKMQAIDADVPKQQNVYDCGLYVLEFLLYLLRRPERFSRLGLESHQSWFDQSLITHRRVQMRQLSQQLLQHGRQRGQSDVSLLLRDPKLRSSAREALTSEPDKKETNYEPWRPPSMPSQWWDQWNQSWNWESWHPSKRGRYGS